MEKDDFVQRPSSSVVNSESLRTLRVSIVYENNPQYPRKRMEEKIAWFVNASQCRELDRIDGEPMEFEWKISQDSH